MKVLMILLSTCALGASQSSAPTPALHTYPLCRVCGDGKVVTKRDLQIQFPGQELLSCGVISDAGKNGQIEPAHCAALPDLIHDECGCTLTPEPGTFPYCDVCGKGKEVTAPDVSLVFPGHEPWTCAEVDLAGKNGQIEEIGCLALPSLIEVHCGCEEIQSESTVPPIGAFPPCKVCGSGRRITETSTSVVFASHGSFTCEQIDNAGQLGLIEPSYCAGMPAVIDIPCGCSNNPTSSPAHSDSAPGPSSTLVVASTPSLKNTPSPSALLIQVPTSVPTVFVGSGPQLNSAVQTQSASSNNTFSPGGILGIVVAVATGFWVVTATIILTGRRRKERKTTAPGEVVSVDATTVKSDSQIA